MKHCFAYNLVLCLFFLGSMQQLVAQKETPASEFDYYFNTECTGIVISRYNGKAKSVTIPSIIEGYPVIEIGHMAFEDKEELVFVTIPASVKKIGSLAFYDCEKLKTVNIGAKTIEYVTDLPETIVIDGNSLAIHDGGNEAFFECGALSLKEQKKIRETGYKGRF